MAVDLPSEFVARLHQLLSPDLVAHTLATFAAARPVAWRINTLRAEPLAVRRQLASEGIRCLPGWNETSSWAGPDDRERVVRHPLASSGEIYIHGLSSQLASLLVDPQPGETILDLAAAPGGKTSHLAALMQNRGELCAVEPIRKRFFRLRANLERLGVSNARTFLADGRGVGHKVPGKFDRVLLDAPCSAEGRFRIGEPETHRTWSLRKIRECQRKQWGLLRSAFDATRPGGTILYCTCSFAPEENEAVVAHLLSAFPRQAEVLPIEISGAVALPGITTFGSETWPADVSRARRLIPGKGHDAFFYARIEKRRSG